MYYLLSLPLVLVAAGLFMTVRAAFSAPEGYEDEAGFHLSVTGAPGVSQDGDAAVSLGSREALMFR